MEQVYSGPKYVTIQEVIDAKKIADRWGLLDPYPHVSVWMNKDWLKFKYDDSTNDERG